MVGKRTPKDPRSTGRKRGRKVLLESGRPYECVCEGEFCPGHTGYCGYSPEKQSRSDTLDVNHKNKNILDNDRANLEWLCRSCHKNIDKQTDVGVSIIEDEFGYGEVLDYDW